MLDLQYPIKRMAKLRQELLTADLAIISGQDEKIQYKNVHKSIKMKGGSQPKEIKAVDLWVDFQSHFDDGDFKSAAIFYYQLRRLIGA